MVPPVNTSGAFLLVLMNLLTQVWRAPVSLGVPVETAFPHLWARTTSVRRALLSGMTDIFSFQMVTPCGTDRDVVPLTPVAPSMHHRGSM